MAEGDLDGNALLLLGEIRGQMRELIHTANNTAMKVDGVSARVALLEASENRRKGAFDLGRAIMRSPVIAWLAAAGAGLYALLKL